MRQRKAKDLEKRLQECSVYMIELSPKGEAETGHWFPGRSGADLYFEIGCGKGDFILQKAEADPESNFVGIEGQETVILRAMEKDSGLKISHLKVDGGASANNFLMQFQADVLDAEVVRPQCVETTAMGAAFLAGLAVGYWSDLDDVRKSWALGHTFKPKMPDTERDMLLAGWKRAVRAAVAWTDVK